VERAHDLAYLIVSAALTLLSATVTFRFALSGGGLEIVLLAGVTLGLAFLTRRCYRRLRGMGKDSDLNTVP
jgi:hypothetical protein